MSRRLKRTNLFSKDVSSLLYAYGDVPQPLQSTIHCLDELVAQYLVDVCTSASRVSQNSQRSKVKLEDFRFALRKDSVKLGRAEELIATNKVIIEAKKQFNEADNSSLKRFRDKDNNDLSEGEDYQDRENSEIIDMSTTDKPKTSIKTKSKTTRPYKKRSK